MISVGTVVEWTSQSNGRQTVKRGAVIAVVPAGMAPGPTSKNRNPGMARDHDSFFIRVKGKRGGVYWPRVAALKVVEEEPAP